MNHEQALRIVLIAIFLVVFPNSLYYRLKSQATREKLDRTKEGVLILATLRPVGTAFMLATIFYMVDPARMAWSSMPLPAWVRWIWVGADALAAALLIWTMRRLGKNLTDTVVTRREHTLVTTGPYHWVRHPFYDALALFVVGNALITANGFILAAGGLLLVLIVARTRREEEHLVARFGDAYREYMQRTGRFLPGIRAHRA